MRIAVLGAGRLGAYRAKLLAESPEVTDVVLGNRTPEKARAVAESTPKVRATALDGVYATPVDAFVVALGSEAHAEALRRVLPLGLPVLCEKPLGVTLEETTDLVELAREHGARLQVGFQRRFDPGYREAYERVRSGRVGTLYSIGMVTSDHHVIPEEFIPGSGGIFRDFLIHDFDIARWLTGREIATVYAYASVRFNARFARFRDADTAVVQLTMDDGLPVSIRASRHNPVGHDVRVEVLGSEDSVGAGYGPWTPVRSVDRGGGTVTGSYDAYLDRFDAAFRAEIGAFLAFAAGSMPNPCPPESSLEALRAAIASELSVAQRGPIEVAQVTRTPQPFALT
jgi:myo-inositol 2-dehydrogenase/D-chiro-inositol 1-dehydrogenase